MSKNQEPTDGFDGLMERIDESSKSLVSEVTMGEALRPVGKVIKIAGKLNKVVGTAVDTIEALQEADEAIQEAIAANTPARKAWQKIQAIRTEAVWHDRTSRNILFAAQEFERLVKQKNLSSTDKQELERMRVYLSSSLRLLAQEDFSIGGTTATRNLAAECLGESRELMKKADVFEAELRFLVSKDRLAQVSNQDLTLQEMPEVSRLIMSGAKHSGRSIPEKQAILLAEKAEVLASKSGGTVLYGVSDSGLSSGFIDSATGYMQRQSKQDQQLARDAVSTYRSMKSLEATKTLTVTEAKYRALVPQDTAIPIRPTQDEDYVRLWANPDTFWDAANKENAMKRMQAVKPDTLNYCWKLWHLAMEAERDRDTAAMKALGNRFRGELPHITAVLGAANPFVQWLTAKVTQYAALNSPRKSSELGPPSPFMISDSVISPDGSIGQGVPATGLGTNARDAGQQAAGHAAPASGRIAPSAVAPGEVFGPPSPPPPPRQFPQLAPWWLDMNRLGNYPLRPPFTPKKPLFTVPHYTIPPAWQPNTWGNAGIPSPGVVLQPYGRQLLGLAPDQPLPDAIIPHLNALLAAGKFAEARAYLERVVPPLERSALGLLPTVQAMRRVLTQLQAQPIPVPGQGVPATSRTAQQQVETGPASAPPAIGPSAVGGEEPLAPAAFTRALWDARRDRGVMRDYLGAFADLWRAKFAPVLRETILGDPAHPGTPGDVLARVHARLTGLATRLVGKDRLPGALTTAGALTLLADERTTDTDEGALSGALGGTQLASGLGGLLHSAFLASPIGLALGGVLGAVFGASSASRRAEHEAQRLRAAQLAELRRLNNALVPVTDYFRGLGLAVLPSALTFGAGDLATGYAAMTSRGVR